MFFHQPVLTVRCPSRSLALVVPDRDRLLNVCEPAERRRLQRCLGKPSEHELPWVVQWQKMPGDALDPGEVVATLGRDGVLVELSYAQRGTLTEWLVTRGTPVAVGTRLALLERRAKTAPARAPEPPSNALLRQYVARQRSDAETIAALQAELALLQARLESGAVASGDDAKFRRLKLEFSRRFHPDVAPAGDAERERRARVFQEFWPVVEEIERS
jgi:pyruvate/2-oxoglutarate dehydrogenase complex dihydrolipoamide acyltransferase (E2) component